MISTHPSFLEVRKAKDSSKVLCSSLWLCGIALASKIKQVCWKPMENCLRFVRDTRGLHLSLLYLLALNAEALRWWLELWQSSCNQMDKNKSDYETCPDNAEQLEQYHQTLSLRSAIKWEKWDPFFHTRMINFFI